MRCYKKLKRLQKKREGIVTQNHKTVHCDLLTDIVETVENIIGQSDIIYQTVQCEERKDSGHTVENRGGHSDKKTVGTV